MISNRVSSMQESVTIKMARLAGELKAEGKNVISLSLGEPDFNTPEFIKDAAKKALDENHTHYTPVPGTTNLRKAICHKFSRDNKLEYTPDQIVVSTGAKQCLMNIVLSTVNPGDEVILPAPFWVSYIEMAKFAEGRPVIIETDISSDFKITPEQLESAITDKSKLFIFSNPCNPSGSFYTTNELKELAAVFAKYPQLLIVSDEIYEYINFGQDTISLGTIDTIKDRVITVNGLSKGHAMTGWRLGYMGAPLEVAKACGKIQGQFTSGTSAITQQAAITAIEESPEKIYFMRDTFHRRRDLMRALLEEIPGLKVNNPQGAFYLFPDVSAFLGKSYKGQKIESSNDLCMLLLSECLVAMTAGEAFGCPNNVRISYANSDEQLKEATQRIRPVLEEILNS